MTAKTWTITDAANNTSVDELNIRPEDVGGAAKGYQVAKRTLRGGLKEGVDEILIDNGRLSFVILPTRGMGIWKAWHRGEEIGWKSPTPGPVHPQFVPLFEPSGLGWLDGFDELMVRCGLQSNGAPDFDEDGRLQYPLHGRIANKPARKVEVSIDGDTGEISVTGVVEEIRFHFLKLQLTSTISTTVGEPSLRIHDEVENLSASEAEMQMLYHINFGAPLLESGSRVVAPAKNVVPRNAHAAEGVGNWDSYNAPQPGYEEKVYFLDLHGDVNGNTQVLMKNAHSTRGMSLHFHRKQLPCFTIWKNTTDQRDGYVTGLEPATNYPNPRGFEGEQGRLVKLAGGGKFSFDVKMSYHDSAKSVEEAQQAVARIQGDNEPNVFDAPQPKWCAP